MALYMDVHNSLPTGTTVANVAEAHAADLEVQERYGVRYLHYWVDAEGGKVFCLIEAPSAHAAHAVHREAHGLVADEIYPVTQGDDVRVRDEGVDRGRQPRRASANDDCAIKGLRLRQVLP